MIRPPASASRGLATSDIDASIPATPPELRPSRAVLKPIPPDSRAACARPAPRPGRHVPETGRAGPVATESRRYRGRTGRVSFAGRDASGLRPDRAGTARLRPPSGDTSFVPDSGLRPDRGGIPRFPPPKEGRVAVRGAGVNWNPHHTRPADPRHPP